MAQPTQINKKAKAIFATILAKLKSEGREEGQYLKIDAYPDEEDKLFMPLTVEAVGDGIETPYSSNVKGRLISLCHYKYQNGDAMQDPEVVFLVIDRRTEHNQWDMDELLIFPQMFQQAGLFARCQQLIVIEDNKLSKYSPKQQRDVAQFCATWFPNIAHQQNIKAVSTKNPRENNGTKLDKVNTRGILGKYNRIMDKVKALGFSSIAEAIKAGKEKELQDAM